MPTYEYRCQSCGHLFEEFQNIKEEPLKKCPKCQGKVKRLIGSGVGLIFRGSGFYSTDYKKKTGEKKEDTGDKSPQKAKDPGASSGSSSADSVSKNV